MSPFLQLKRVRQLALSVSVIMYLVGCGGSGGQDPILGTPGAGMTPSVQATSPTSGASSVATNAEVTVTFNKAMSESSVSSSFSVACPISGVGSELTDVSSSVSYDATNHIATLQPSAVLPAGKICQGTVTTSAKSSDGYSLPENYVWLFTVSLSTDTTRPTITVITPVEAATSVATNTKVTATFSESMNATLVSSSFSLANVTAGTPGVTVAGTVTYADSSKTATFSPTAALSSNATYTATVSTSAQDLAGNALLVDRAWTFTTGSSGDTTPPTVTTVSPTDAATDVCLTKTVSATFSEAMDAATINDTNVTVTNAGVAVAGTVTYDASNKVGTFTASATAGFAPSTAFVATVKVGATDLAGNGLATAKTWGFTTGTQACLSAVNLRTVASYGSFGGGAGATNQGVNTIVNGDLGTTAVCTAITGFHDASNVYTETTLNIGAVNGSIYCNAPLPGTTATMAIATQAAADAQLAYDNMAGMTANLYSSSSLAGATLTPGIYTAPGGSFDITTGNLTLDAQGDPDAVWIFQVPSSLTIGLTATPRSVLLLNGAQAKNVFWQVGSAARIENGSTMLGTIIASAGVTISTSGQTALTYLTGRAIGLNASVTMVNTIITTP
ncbi:hypothetical protein B9Z39_10390 [Limnohabitans sp. JirII-29]|nr:hypothetical protein B9Z39_10390 [Limnohabitans sp. JirII-29]